MPYLFIAKGKSGGYRVITFYATASVPVFLLTMFGKNEKASLTQAERNDLAKLLAAGLQERRLPHKELKR